MTSISFLFFKLHNIISIYPITAPQEKKTVCTVGFINISVIFTFIYNGPFDRVSSSPPFLGCPLFSTGAHCCLPSVRLTHPLCVRACACNGWGLGWLLIWGVFFSFFNRLLPHVEFVFVPHPFCCISNEKVKHCVDFQISEGPLA